VWTRNRVDLLTRLYGEGKTDHEIAAILGGTITSDSVGRQRKLLKLVEAEPDPASKEEAREFFNPAARFSADAEEKQTPEAQFMERAAAAFYGSLEEEHCGWPHGEPCTQPREPGQPYCEEHQRQSLKPAPKPRRRNYRHPSQRVFG
jgi:hypothetical protein